MASENKGWHEMSVESLKQELAVLKSDLGKMQLEHAIRGIADNSQFKKIRRNIAQINTELRSRELAQYSSEQLEMRSRIRARRARLKKA